MTARLRCDVCGTQTENLPYPSRYYRGLCPQYTQAISNLQSDYIQSIKNLAGSGTSAMYQFIQLEQYTVGNTLHTTIRCTDQQYNQEPCYQQPINYQCS